MLPIGTLTLGFVMNKSSLPPAYRQALNRAGTGQAGTKGGGRSGSEVEFILEKDNELHLRVRAKENVLLVLSDTYYPGWKAFLNGKETKIYKANYNFRAIPLKAGEYEVKFIYNPISFKIGILVSLLTLIGVVVYFVRRKWRILGK